METFSTDYILELGVYDIMLDHQHAVLRTGAFWKQNSLTETIIQSILNGDTFLTHFDYKFAVDKVSGREGIHCRLIVISKEIENQLHVDLLKERNFFELILDNLPVDVAVFDCDHRYRYVSKMAIKDDEVRKWIIGKTDFDYAAFRGQSEEIAQNRHQTFEQVMQFAKAFSSVDTHTTIEGIQKVVQRNFIPVLKEDQEVDFVVGFGLDITQIKTAELIAKSSEENYLKLFDNNLIGIFQSDMDANFTLVNNAYARIFDMATADDLIGKSYLDLVADPTDYNMMSDEFRKAGSLKNYVMRNVLKSGKVIWTLVNATLIREQGGGIEGTLLDITLQREKELEIQRKKQMLDLLENFINCSADGLQVADDQGRLVFVNNTSSERLGINQEEATNYKLSDFQPFFKQDGAWENHVLELKEKQKITVKTEHINLKTGKKIPVELNVNSKCINGQFYVIASSIDISERLAYEKKLSDTNRFMELINSAIDSTSLITETDLKGNISYVNDNFCRVSQYNMNELIGKNHNIVNSGHHSEAFWADFWQTIKIGEIWNGEIKNKAKDGSYYWVNTTIYPVKDDQGVVRSFLSVRQDITLMKRQAERLDYYNGLLSNLTSITTEFINVPLDELNAKINEALEKIGSFIGIDRVSIFEYHFDRKTLSSNYHWSKDGSNKLHDFIERPIDPLINWTEKHLKGEAVENSNINDLPDSIVKEQLKLQGIKSVLTIPLMDFEQCIGFIGLDSYSEKQGYTIDEKRLLNLLGEALINVFRRVRNLRKLNESREQIEEINKNLELEVEKQTNQNAELSRILSEQELLASIGEMAAGVAHDLNTPLGAIKAGAENIRNTLENLFHRLIYQCQPEQLDFACKRAENNTVELFVGGMQARQETASYKALLDEQDDSDQALNLRLARSFVKARVPIDDVDTFNLVLAAENKFEFLDLMYHIQTIRNLVGTVMTSGERATDVVKNIRSFIQVNTKTNFSKLNLYQNISTVLNVFNYQLKHNYKLHFDVDKSFEIVGRDVSLYQMWSNLIKNAIDVAPQHTTLEVVAKETPESIVVSITNEGPMIPEEIRGHIFKKFFTTKREKNGTGLGLSIVKRTADEHQAQVHVESNEHKTTFSIEFPKNGLITERNM